MMGHFNFYRDCFIFLGRCKARPFNSYDVYFLFLFFVSFLFLSVPQHILPLAVQSMAHPLGPIDLVYVEAALAPMNKSARRCRFFMYIAYFFFSPISIWAMLKRM